MYRAKKNKKTWFLKVWKVCCDEIGCSLHKLGRVCTVRSHKEKQEPVLGKDVYQYWSQTMQEP